MSSIRSLLIMALLAGEWPRAVAAEGKTNQEPPRIIGAIPFALSAGAVNRFKVIGLSLTNAGAVRFPSAEKLSAEIKSRGKAAVPEKAEAKKAGDTQIGVELTLPDDFPAGELAFAVSTPEGETNTNRLHVVPRELLLDEQEPNAGFRKPDAIRIPQFIRGAIAAAQDVDVFEFTGQAGQKLRVESLSGRYGSPLDPVVTLHDAQGHALATHDDVAGSADASLRFTLPKDARYFLSVIDAHDRGGAAYGYLLKVTSE